MTNAPRVLLSAILACGTTYATSPDAWAAYYKEVTSLCIKASGLRNARPAGDPVDFEDRVGYTAMVIRGDYPQPHMKNQHGRVLCLFEKRSRTPYISPADTIIRSRKP